VILVALAGVLPLAGADTTAAQKKPRQSAKTAAAKPGSKTSGTHSKTAARRGKGSRKKSAQSWRSRQTAPTPDRYKEIQGALASRGYLEGTPTGVWDSQSTEALRRFQKDQNLEPNGKLNSLSLIALGLGAKRPAAPAVTAPASRTPAPQSPATNPPSTPPPSTTPPEPRQ